MRESGGRESKRRMLCPCFVRCMSCARSKGMKRIEREGNKDGSLLLNTSTRGRRKRNIERNEATPRAM